MIVVVGSATLMTAITYNTYYKRHTHTHYSTLLLCMWTGESTVKSSLREDGLELLVVGREDAATLSPASPASQSPSSITVESTTGRLKTSLPMGICLPFRRLSCLLGLYVAARLSCACEIEVSSIFTWIQHRQESHYNMFSSQQDCLRGLHYC